MRRVIIFIAALMALFGSLSAVFVTLQARDYDLRGYVDATQTTNLPYRLPRLGVNADLLQYSPDEVRQHLQWMQEAHITWVRQFAYWDMLEPQAGVYEWAEWDIIIDTLEDFPDLELVVFFMNSPQWARTSDVVTAPPDDPTAMTPFLQEFAHRYGEQVDYYQVWDEPNLDDTWGLVDPRPAEYAALLSEAYTAIHGTDLEATIIAAALAPTTERNGQNIADTVYLEALYQLGADSYFDAVAAKPYGFDFSPDDRTVNVDVLNFSRIVALRDIMVAYGDESTALWASNWGWNSLPSDWGGLPSIWGNTTEQDRINYTLNALSRADREWAWLGGMILQNWQPNTTFDDPLWGFSLIDQSNMPNTLWSALVEREIPNVATNGLYHPRTLYARYSGLWTFSDLGADIGWLETTDSQVEFDFLGQDVALLLREGDYFAFAYPQVDGEQANATSRDSNGNAYIFLRSGTLERELTIEPVSRNLSDAEHTLSIVFDKGWDQWALAGFAVSDGNLAEPYNRQLWVAWIAVAVSVVTVIVTGRLLAWKKLIQVLHPLLSRFNFALQIAIAVITSLALMAGMLLTWAEPIPQIMRRALWESLLPIILTGGLLVLKPGILLVVITSLLLFLIIYNRLEIGLLLVILYVPFFLFPVELYTYAFPMSELVLLITAGAWTSRLLAQWGYERQSANGDYPLRLTISLNIIDALVLILGILAIVSLLWTERLSLAITELRKLILEPLLFYIILRSIKPNKHTLLRLVDMLLIAGMLVAIIGLYLFVRGEAIITAEEGARRLASVYGSPNNVGLFLGRCIPFALAYILISTQRYRQTMGVIVFGTMLLAVALTQSVGTLLFGVPAGIGIVLLLVWKQRAISILVGLLIAGIMIVFGLTQVSPRFANLLDLSTGTNFIRLRIWESSIDIIRDNPITGLGLDQFLYAFRGHYIRPDAIFDPNLSHPHNILFDFWIRLGLGGVLWLIALLFNFWRKMLQSYMTTVHDPIWQMLIIGTMASMAVVVVHGLVDNSVFVDDLVYVFMLLLVICACSVNVRTILTE
ncbi:MAG: O-antigen ligase family protein [Anaerolineae bacterium]|nr:O-antigen ligase family protein [Anaerolineae bacterium]